MRSNLATIIRSGISPVAYQMSLPHRFVRKSPLCRTKRHYQGNRFGKSLAGERNGSGMEFSGDSVRESPLRRTDCPSLAIPFGKTQKGSRVKQGQLSLFYILKNGSILTHNLLRTTLPIWMTFSTRSPSKHTHLVEYAGVFDKVPSMNRRPCRICP